MAYTSVNWNVEEDEFDEYVWDKATAQFWLDTRVPVSNDRGDWRTLTDSEKGVINKVVGGLALLDTLQSEEGVNVMRRPDPQGSWRDQRFLDDGIDPRQELWDDPEHFKRSKDD